MSVKRGAQRSAVVLAIAVVALVVLSGAPAHGAPATTGSVTYSVQSGSYNNTVRLGPSGILSSPRVVAGPNPTNLSQVDEYVLGLNDTGYSSCSNLAVFRSTDSGSSFVNVSPTRECLPGGAVDAVVLPNGTIVIAAAGPEILISEDGGATWSLPVVLSNSTSLPALYLDSTSGELYLSWTGAPGNSTGGLFVSASSDGGLAWTRSVSVLPPGESAGVPQIAAYGNNLTVSFLQQIWTPLPGPFPPPSGNNTTYPIGWALTEAVATVASTDSGATWAKPDVLVPANLSLLVGEPSVAVSSNGTLGLSWSQDNSTPTQNGTFVAISHDGGLAWSAPIAVSPTGPPLVGIGTYQHDAVFDASGRLFVTWHNYSTTNPLGAQLNVAISDQSLSSFATSSFSLAFRTEVGNGTQYENLALGPSGQVLLAWDVYGPWGEPQYGIFVRTVSGEAVGSVSGAAGAATVELTNPVSGKIEGRAEWNGQPFTLGGLSPDSYDVWVMVGNQSIFGGEIPIVPWGATTFVVQTGLASGPASQSPYPFLILGAAGVVMGVVASLSYTRLTKETVLRQKLRSLIFEYIQTEPGASFSSIRDALGLQNGTTSYHLSVLEREGFVQSVVRGRRRYYFPIDGAITSLSPPLSGIQASILSKVASIPGLGLRELSRAVGHEPSSVAYSARVLAKEGLLRMVRVGLRLRFYPAGS